MKRLFLLTVLLSTFCLTKAQNPGDFDLTFGNNGIVALTASDNLNQARNFMVMPDGKIMVAGAVRVYNNNVMFLGRLNPDGSSDTSFGEGGAVIFYREDYYAQYPDDIDMIGDKIIVAGYLFEPGTIPFLMCLNQDGSLDPDFAGGGLTTINDGSAMIARHMVVKNDMIYWSGYRNDICCVARYHANGDIDTSFGDNGLVITPLNEEIACNGEELVVLDDGRIIVAGWHNNYGSSYNSAVYCLTPDGSLDTSFADNGILRLNLSESHDFFVSICQQSDGKLIAGGHYWISDSPLQYGVALVRFDDKGVLDPTFGDGGIFMHQYFENGESYCVDVEIAQDDQIFFGGWCQIGSQRDLFAGAVNNDGTVNTDFGENGCTVIPFDGDHQAYDMDIDNDGKLIVMGHDYYNILMARLHTGVVITDVDEIAQPEKELLVHPNPAVDELYLDDIQEDGTATVYDVMGRKVMETTVKANGLLNVSDLSKGIYTIVIVSGDETFNARFVK